MADNGGLDGWLIGVNRHIISEGEHLSDHCPTKFDPNWASQFIELGRKTRGIV